MEAPFRNKIRKTNTAKYVVPQIRLETILPNEVRVREFLLDINRLGHMALYKYRIVKHGIVGTGMSVQTQYYDSVQAWYSETYLPEYSTLHLLEIVQKSIRKHNLLESIIMNSIVLSTIDCHKNLHQWIFCEKKKIYITRIHIKNS